MLVSYLQGLGQTICVLTCVPGKGIADQDRNILSNQLLLLNFLSSASKILAEGPIPSAFGKKKRKKKGEDDDESEPEVSGEEDEDMVEEGPKPRGTVLITLRNVVPYTQW
jgi:25S rRNA (uracil2634-N3)-methyltransferase